MRGMKNTWLTAIACAVLATPSIAAAQVEPVTPAMPALPAMPMLAPMPPVPPMHLFDRMRPMLAGIDFGWATLEDGQGTREDEPRQRADEEKQRAEEQKQRAVERRRRIDESYQRGQESLERRQWSRAADQFTSVIEAQNSTRVDAALYWKAYAFDKLSQQADALTALGELIKGFPQSRWLSDAKALELQVRQNAGQSPRPEAEQDEDLKLLAIQGLQHSDPEQAVPMLETLLRGAASPRLKERALFVLAQSNATRARTVLTQIARGGSNPDVQRKAIQYLGVNGTRENRAVLAEIYASSADVDIKRQVINALFVQNNAESLVAIARKETDPAMKREMVQKLSLMKSKVALDYLMEILNK